MTAPPPANGMMEAFRDRSTINVMTDRLNSVVLSVRYPMSTLFVAEAAGNSSESMSCGRCCRRKPHPRLAVIALRYDVSASTIAAPQPVMDNVTRILSALNRGDPGAASELLPLVYEELRKLAAHRMAGERPDHTLQATALVHEAYVRLVGANNAQRWNGRGHFFAAAAEAMRRILVENARGKGRLKRGGGARRQRIELSAAEPPAAGLSDDILALHEALGKLEVQHPRKAQLVKLRFFAGLTNEQAAQVLEISTSTADNDWAYARCWLRLEISGDPSPCSPG